MLCVRCEGDRVSYSSWDGMIREEEGFWVFFFLRRGDCLCGWEETTFEEEIPFNSKLASIPFGFAIEKRC